MVVCLYVLAFLLYGTLSWMSGWRTECYSLTYLYIWKMSHHSFAVKTFKNHFLKIGILFQLTLTITDWNHD